MIADLDVHILKPTKEEIIINDCILVVFNCILILSNCIHSRNSLGVKYSSYVIADQYNHQVILQRQKFIWKK